jgi:hypothetical protein
MDIAPKVEIGALMIKGLRWGAKEKDKRQVKIVRNVVAGHSNVQTLVQLQILIIAM